MEWWIAAVFGLLCVVLLVVSLLQRSRIGVWRERDRERQAQEENLRRQAQDSAAREAALAVELARAASETEGVRMRCTEQSAEIERLRAEVQRLTAELSRAQTRAEALEEKVAGDRAELEKVQASFRAEFRNLANDMLEEKSRQFKELNRESLEVLLKPFRDNVSEFRQRVEQIYSNENEQRGVLKAEIHNLVELNRRITEETTNLTNALRGNSKVQGDWGEMILETILDSSNLVNGIHYTTQCNLKDEAGNNLRPDVVLNLPDGKQVVIDAKVSLTAFVGYANADAGPERDGFLRDHLRSVRAHVDELGAKRYQELVNSPDFVIMFVPNEPAFLAALQADSTIWNDAYRKKVIVSSPTNLFALLKIVDDLWKRDTQSRNALEIATQGANLYDKFVGFVESLEGIGKGIDSLKAGYDKAMGQLKTGNGNLVRRAERLRKLGVKTAKTLPTSLTECSEEEGE